LYRNRGLKTETNGESIAQELKKRHKEREREGILKNFKGTLKISSDVKCFV
jgi:hypothetical protein